MQNKCWHHIKHDTTLERNMTMKILLIMFLIIYILMFLFGKVTINESTNISTLQRAAVCLIGSSLLTLVFGLPILGIVYLVTNIM